ncbi:hypothetical protein IQ07DRAFT_640241 [Pyrenochaeta sp. DS3sAY3a]|nr:hypothetical protein IQ07DRAFT_640241 [Pyrenochaeta sp. DS3sAY3a]
MSHEDCSPPRPLAKRRRMNFACDHCRSHNNGPRCDGGRPCFTCRVAGIPCGFVNRHQPEAEVQRNASGTEAAHLSEVDESKTPRSASRVVANPSQDTEPTAVARFQRRPAAFWPHRTRSSVDNLTAWLRLALGRSGSLSTVGSIGYTSPWRCLPSISKPPPLPEIECCKVLVSHYFATVNSIFPFVEQETIKRAISSVHKVGINRFVEEYGPALLLQTYLVLVHSGRRRPELARSHLCDMEDYCQMLQGHVLSHVDDLEAVQANALMALCLKEEGKDAAAWATLMQTFSMIGSYMKNPFLRFFHSFPRLKYLRKDERVLWGLRCFEQFFAFELGRSTVHSKRRQIIDELSVSLVESRSSDERNFIAVVGFAEALGEIGFTCISANDHEGNSPEDKDSRSQILAKRGRTDCGLKRLATFADLPLEVNNYPIRAFLSMQYFNAVLMLARNSMLTSKEEIFAAMNGAMELSATLRPWAQHVRDMEHMTADTARKCLNLTIRGADNDQTPVLTLASISLHAIYALHIYTVRNPTWYSVPSDRLLIEEVVDYLQSSRADRDDDIRIALSYFSLLMDDEFDQVSHKVGQSTAETRSGTHQRTETTTSSLFENNLPRIEIPRVETLGKSVQYSRKESDSERVFSTHDHIGWDWATYHESLLVQNAGWI